jgi:hypothetical protein
MNIHRRNGLVIQTSHDYPPIPNRNFDWSAVLDSYEGELGDPHGQGPTEEAAIADLLEQLEDANDQELRHAVETGEWRAP